MTCWRAEAAAAAACVAIAVALLQGCGGSGSGSGSDPVTSWLEVSAGGTTVKILGHSGKFRMFSEDAGENDTNAVTIEMDALREIAADGTTVGSSGHEKHSIHTFASQDFNFSTVDDATLGVNDSVTAQKVSFNSSVGNVGRVVVDTFVMSSAGLVGPEGDDWQAGPGDVKFNINFPKWSFCGDDGATCKHGQTMEVGEFLELDIKIKGAADTAVPVPGTSNTYSLGGGANLTLTNEVTIDGEQVQMPAGYPKVHMQGHSLVLTFRFPKFNTSASYDPLLSQNWQSRFGNIAYELPEGTAQIFV